MILCTGAYTHHTARMSCIRKVQKGTKCFSLISYLFPHHANDHTAYKIDENAS